MKKINITASDMDEFKKIEDLLKTLPETVSSHILSAKYGGVGVECIIEDDYKSDQKIYIPNYVTQISHFDGYIGIYCDRFFFKLTGKLIEKKCTYVFVNCEK
jgi:hypothetical protein